MKFCRSVSYIHFFLTLTSLVLMGYMYNESQKHAEHEMIVMPPNPLLEQRLTNGVVRDTQIMQGILMTHHKLGIHPPGKQDMCPLCEVQEGNKLNTIIVNGEE